MAIDLTCALTDCTFVVVDLETTGIKPPFARITEVGAVRVRNGEVGLELGQLINPGCSIPPFIARMTGITDEMLWGQPTIEEIWPLLEEFMGDALIVAHNASFDVRFLDHESWRLTGTPLPNLDLCTVSMSRRAWPHLSRHNLDSVARHLGLDFMARHRALGDARVTAHVLINALHAMRNQGIHTLGDLVRCLRSRRCRARLRELLKDFDMQVREPRPNRRRGAHDAALTPVPDEATLSGC